MEIDLSQYQNLVKHFFEIASVCAAVVFAFLRQYSARKQKQAEAEALAKKSRVRELEVTLMMKKQEVQDLFHSNENLSEQLEEEKEERIKYQTKYENLRDSLL